MKPGRQRKMQEKAIDDASWETVKKKEPKPRKVVAPAPPSSGSHKSPPVHAPAEAQKYAHLPAQALGLPHASRSPEVALPALIGVHAALLGASVTIFPGLPRDIANFIGELLSDNRGALVRMRRVCRTWRTWVSTLPVYIAWQVSPRPLPISIGAVRKCLASFGSLTGLALGNYALSVEDLATLGTLVGPRLRHLQFRLHSGGMETPTPGERLIAFTALESVSAAVAQLNMLFTTLESQSLPPRQQKNVVWTPTVFSHLHTLSLHLDVEADLAISRHTRFPALTALSLSKIRLHKISNESVYTNLRHFSFFIKQYPWSWPRRDHQLPNSIIHAMCAPNLRELVIEAAESSYEVDQNRESVTSLSCIGRADPAFIARFPNLRYLDVSDTGNAWVWSAKVMPVLADLRTLRAVNSPILEWFIQLAVRSLAPLLPAHGANAAAARLLPMPGEGRREAPRGHCVPEGAHGAARH